MEEKPSTLYESIQFKGDHGSRQKALEKLDKAFKEMGVDLISYAKTNKITITEERDYYAIEVLIHIPEHKDSFNVWQFDIDKNINEGFYVDIKFVGSRALKKEAITLLDKVLREQGNLGVYGDLSGGIDEIRIDMNIKVIEANEYYRISIFPKSSSGGHSFSFTINKETGKRSNVVVGEVLPPPFPDFNK